MRGALTLPSIAIVIALLLGGATAGASAQDAKPVHYSCADGRGLRAMFSHPGIGTGSVKLVDIESLTETTLSQAVSASGGRYIHGDVEFWNKGSGATLTQAGKATSCNTSG